MAKVAHAGGHQVTDLSLICLISLKSLILLISLEDIRSPALRKLLETTDLGTTDAEFAHTHMAHDVPVSKMRKSALAMKSWQCTVCHAQCNDSERDSCLVCQTKVPTYACTVCLQDNKIFMRFCRHCHSPQSAMPRLRRKLSMDPASVFARADIDSSGELSLNEWLRAFRDEVIDADVLERLFHEFDVDKDGSVTLDEFKQGLERGDAAKNVQQELFADQIENCSNNPAKSPHKPLRSDPEAEKKIKPGYVKLYIADGEAARRAFQVKKSAKLSSLFAKYCEKRKVDVLHVEFTFKSQVLNGSQTPDDIGLQDLNTIFCIPDTGASQMNQPAPVDAPVKGPVLFTFSPLSTKPPASGPAAPLFSLSGPPQQFSFPGSQQQATAGHGAPDEALQAALNASAEVAPSTWSCAACTLLNSEPLVECAACGGRERAAPLPGPPGGKQFSKVLYNSGFT